MRKVIIVLACILKLALIVGLIWVLEPFGSFYDLEHETEVWSEVKIEIVEITDWIDSTYYTNTPYENAYTEDKIKVIKQVDDPDEFIAELRSLWNYRPFIGDPYSSVSGMGIRIIYPDSYIELITVSGSALVSPSHVSIYTKT